MEHMRSTSPSLPPNLARTGPARAKKRSGPVPAWGLKLGGFLTTIGVFLSSFGYASAHLYVTNAPLQPATVTEVAAANTSASTATAATSTARTTTTTLRSAVRTTTQTAVTVTKKS
jgi:hypothetical protein